MELDEPLQILTQLRQVRAHLSGVLLNLFCEIYVSWLSVVLTPRCIRRQERQQENREERPDTGEREEKTNIPHPGPWLETQHTCNVSSAINKTSRIKCIVWPEPMTCYPYWGFSWAPLVMIFILCNGQHTPELLLIKQAASCERAEYFHLLSSQTIRQTQR